MTAVIPFQLLAQSSADNEDEDIFEFSPFVVDASKDTGYIAENSLSGSRLNTSLKDTASSVSVYTEEFLEDFGFTDIEDLLAYSVSSVLDQGEDDAGTNLENDNFNASSITSRIRTRGIESSRGMDYFESVTPDDSYRGGRYDESRGPNGILFGISDAGGITNQTSISASTSEDFGNIIFRVDSEDGVRTQIKLNKVLVQDKLGLVIAALDQEEDGWRTNNFENKERIFGALTFRANNRLTVRGNFESGRDTEALAKSMTIRDSSLAWYDNLQAFGIDAVTREPWITAELEDDGQLDVDEESEPTDLEEMRGLDDLKSGRTTYTYISNNSQTFNSAYTFETSGYDTDNVFAPDGTQGRDGNEININDPSIIPYDFNPTGSGGLRDTDIKNYTFSADFRFTNNLYINLSHNYQRSAVDTTIVQGSNPVLKGDPNLTLGPRIDIIDRDGNVLETREAETNPYAGLLYLESNWKRDYHSAEREETRVSLSYSLNTDNLGRHRIAAMSSHSELLESRIGSYLVIPGNLTDANNPSSRENRIMHRTYIEDIDDIYNYALADWRTIKDINVDFDGDGIEETYQPIWANQGGGSQNTSGITNTDTKLIVSQSSFLKNDRLILTLGLRQDESTFSRFGHIEDPLVNDIPDFSTIDEVHEYDAETSTAGMVYHINENFSLVANQSESVGIPDFFRTVLPFGELPQSPDNEGEDYGLAFSLLEDRISGRIIYYTTNARFNTGSGGFGGETEDITAGIGQALISNGVYTEEAWDAITATENLEPDWNGRYQDTDSEGLELSINAQLTKNWTMRINASKTDRIRSNVHSAAIDYFGLLTDSDGMIVRGVTEIEDNLWEVDRDTFADTGVVAKWFGYLDEAGEGSDWNTFADGDNSDSDDDRIGGLLWEIVDDIGDRKESEEKRWGLRPYRFNVATAYRFTEGLLNGVSVGGGFRWQSGIILGEDADGVEVEGDPVTSTDFNLRYRTSIEGRFGGRLSIQLNVRNVFDENEIQPVRISGDADFYVPGGATPTSRGIAYSRLNVVAPRSFILTTSYDF